MKLVKFWIAFTVPPAVRFYHGRQSRISQCKPGGNRAKQVGSADGPFSSKGKKPGRTCTSRVWKADFHN